MKLYPIFQKWPLNCFHSNNENDPSTTYNRQFCQCTWVHKVFLPAHFSYSRCANLLKFQYVNKNMQWRVINWSPQHDQAAFHSPFTLCRSLQYVKTASVNINLHTVSQRSPKLGKDRPEICYLTAAVKPGSIVNHCDWVVTTYFSLSLLLLGRKLGKN